MGAGVWWVGEGGGVVISSDGLYRQQEMPVPVRPRAIEKVQTHSL